MNYPIAEVFYSLQGEGRWVGTPMVFIRFAGCSVGRGKYPFSCTTWDDHIFFCDTNYKRTAAMGIEQLIYEITSHNIDRVCITGGEPLMHPIGNLILKIIECGYKVHIETSGTQLIPNVCSDLRYKDDVWITVSPKKGVHPVILERANEIKVLVGLDTQLEDLLGMFGRLRGKVWLQPIDANKTPYSPAEDYGPLLKCLEFIKHEPAFRLSIQMHKVIGVR